MNGFRDWYIRNQDAITWFFIGWLSMGMFDNLSRGQYLWAAFNAALIWLNYKLISVKL
jgi:hypothetical protein